MEQLLQLGWIALGHAQNNFGSFLFVERIRWQPANQSIVEDSFYLPELVDLELKDRIFQNCRWTQEEHKLIFIIIIFNFYVGLLSLILMD